MTCLAIGMVDILVCPTCGSDLSLRGEGIECERCLAKWPVDEFGVFHQIETSYQYQQTRISTSGLVSEIHNMDPQKFFDIETLSQLERSYDEFGYHYCMNPSRFDWILKESVKGKKIVDLGCGFGGASIHLAKQGAEQVISVDGNRERVQFLGEWARKENIENILPIHGDLLDICFKDHAVDLFVMIGVLEWVGSLNQSLPVEKAQKKLLNKTYNALSSSGKLLLAIENRFSVTHFRGFSPHGEPAFAAILPRFIANHITKLATGSEYRTYIYSQLGYKKLLEDVGFSNIEFCFPLPSYQSPAFVLSSTENRLLAKTLCDFRGSYSRKLALKLFSIVGSTKIASLIFPSYIITGEKRD